MQIVTKFVADLAVSTAKLAALAVTTAKIAADAVTNAKILLANQGFLRGRNAANSADINIVKINASDQVETANLWTFPSVLPQSAVVPVSGSDLVNKTYADSLVSSITGRFEDRTMTGGEIIAQFYDLAQLIKSETLTITVSGVVQEEGVDYTLSTASGVTRVTLAGDLATGGAAALIAGDKVGNRYFS